MDRFFCSRCLGSYFFDLPEVSINWVIFFFNFSYRVDRVVVL